MNNSKKFDPCDLPLVSVLVGCYNHARFVIETLESVRCQTYPNIQLIIWDDKSGDQSPEMIRNWIENHNMACKFLEHSVNRGLCKSLNEALSLASGKYIAMTAADDLWLPEKIARQVNIMESSDSNVGVVYSDVFQIDEQGNALPGMFIESQRKFRNPPVGSLFDVLWEGNFIPAMSTLIRRECYNHVGNYDEDLCFEDWDMWLRISRSYQFAFDAIPSAKYRVVATSMVRTIHKEMVNSMEFFRLKYLYRGWLNLSQVRDTWQNAIEHGRLYPAVSSRDETITILNRTIADHNRTIADLNRTIADLNHTIGGLSKDIHGLEMVVDSAVRWQKRSWFKRAFHKWRPVTQKSRISQLRKLERSFRKRRNKVLASPSGSKEPEFHEPPPLRSKDDIRREAHKDLLQFLASGGKIEFPPVSVGNTPRVSVIIVLYNQAGLTLECLLSLRRNQDVSLEVIIIDNASTDETHLLMERVTGVTFVRNEDNLHFLKSVNQAADYATGEFILLLNNDAMPDPGAIAAAVRRMESSPQIGAVGGKIVLYDGSLQEAGSIVWADGSCLGYGRGDSPDDPIYQFRRSVDYCSGAFLLTRRSLFEQLGRLDTQYCPAYYEETDYCVSLIKAGYEIVYDPFIKIRHFEFASSTTDQSALDLQSRNQRIFAGKNHEFLSSQKNPSDRSVDILSARQRLRKGCKRILIIEDRVPHVSLGSGYPRANAIVRILAEQGHAITLYPLQFPEDDWQNVYESLPDEVEVMLDRGRDGLAEFLRARCGYYDIIFVSRPHNMEVLRNIMAREPGLLGGIGSPRALLVYDAEALYALRDDVKAIVSGKPNPAELSAANIEAELALVGYADTVIAVSEMEAQYFRRSNSSRVVVLGHSVDVVASMNQFGQRSRFLFVGALHSDDSPNADSMRWFTDKIWPLIRTRFDFKVELDIVGPCNAMSIRDLDGKNGVNVHGMVNSLDTFYDQARVFVVPTRFAAGIPLKAYEAASRGIPMVTTHLIASQLGWQGTVSSADDPCEFAQHCIDLFIDEVKWTRNREGILCAVSKDCGIESFSNALFDAIGT